MIFDQLAHKSVFPKHHLFKYLLCRGFTASQTHSLMGQFMSVWRLVLNNLCDAAKTQCLEIILM